MNFSNLLISLDKSSKSPAKEEAGRLFTSEVRQRKSDYKINNLMINFVAQTGSETRNLSSSLNSQPWDEANTTWEKVSVPKGKCS